MHTGESKTVRGKAEPAKKDKHGRYDGLSRKQKRRKMANDEEARENAAVKVSAAIRSAKKAARPVKITEPLRAKSAAAAGKAKKKKAARIGKGSAFGESHEGMRAKPVKVSLAKKGGKGKAKAKVGKR